MKTKDFNFDLPEELIAQTPLLKRDESRLLTLDKETGEVNHLSFKHIEDLLKKDDVLVLNDTRVIPARIFGNKKGTNANIELLLLTKISLNTWQVLAKPAKRLKIGAEIEFGGGILKAKVLECEDEGLRTIEFEYKGVFEEILDELGTMPLPPYIKEKLEDKERYQTIYSKNTGSSAAPTAGLHFTKELLEKLSDKGVQIEYITLHVGLGTFRPVKTEMITEHTMHKEFYTIDPDVLKRLNEAKSNGRRIVCVGTTSVRTLESASSPAGVIEKDSGWTDIFIYPPYDFRFADSIITNFHLPESTLIMMISAFAGKENVMNAYEQAVKNKYRFFSFGDSMYIY